MLNRYLTIPFAVLGDIFFLTIGLFLAFFVRSQAIPQAEFFATHATPFILVLATSLIVFFVAGLYDIHGIVHLRSVYTKVLYSQIANAVFAVVFFYFISTWGITPKTILVLYIGFSSLLLSIWRTLIFPRFLGGLPKEEAIIIAPEPEGELLYSALSHNSPYALVATDAFFVKDSSNVFELQQLFADTLERGDEPKTLIVDMRSPVISTLAPFIYAYAAKGGEVKSFTDVYESVFDKIPESSLTENNIISYIYSQNKGYDTFKRLMDVSIALPFFIVSLALYPIVYIALKIQDGGPIFFIHDRMGRGGKRIKLYKFRSMTFGDTSATWVKTEGNTNKVTRFGHFIRKTRIDELPQLWNVLRGDMSLVGPRPDIWSLGIKCGEERPFFKARLSATPGLSGWAQTHMSKPPQNLEETKEKLLYDLYYIKNRSLTLDLLIALRTVKVLIGREGM